MDTELIWNYTKDELPEVGREVIAGRWDKPNWFYTGQIREVDWGQHQVIIEYMKGVFVDAWDTDFWIYAEDMPMPPKRKE